MSAVRESVRQAGMRQAGRNEAGGGQQQQGEREKHTHTPLAPPLLLLSAAAEHFTERELSMPYSSAA